MKKTKKPTKQNKKAKFLIVWTTVAKKPDAEKIAKTILQKKLAACVSISSPVKSHYYWKNKLCIEKEWVLTIKTIEQLYSKLEATLLQAHPYDCPEVIGIPLLKAAVGYKKWLRDSVSL